MGASEWILLQAFSTFSFFSNRCDCQIALLQNFALRFIAGGGHDWQKIGPGFFISFQNKALFITNRFFWINCAMSTRKQSSEKILCE